MSIPNIQKIKIGSYIVKQLILQRKRFPLVLMLEPLFRCNLTCKGCGKIGQPKEILSKQLSVEQCIDATKQCNAPVVSIPGGEPLLHPEINIIVDKLVEMKKFVYLCTNAILVKKRIDEFKPSDYLSFNIHIDGLRQKHDKLVYQEGIFDKAVEAIKLLTSKGFRVTTNTTFFKGQTAKDACEFFDFLTSLNVEGMTIAPAFSYDSASDQSSFLTKDEAKNLFKEIFKMSEKGKWTFNHSSLYLDFLAGNQNYTCSPWGNPSFSVLGWQKPCYLLCDGHLSTYQELMETTAWDKYGVGNDPRCENCMVHCGFEPTAVMDSVKNPFKAYKIKY